MSERVKVELEPLDELIVYIVVGAKSVSRTKLMKLVYLVERECKNRLGYRLSDAEFVLYFYGPFSFEVQRRLERLVELGILSEKCVEDRYYIYEPSLSAFTVAS